MKRSDSSDSVELMTRMLLKPGTGVRELVYSGHPLDNSKWQTKEKKRETILGNVRKCHGCKGEFLPVHPDHDDGTFMLE